MDGSLIQGMTAAGDTSGLFTQFEPYRQGKEVIIKR